MMKARRNGKRNFPEMSFRLQTEIVPRYSEDIQELGWISLYQNNS